MLRYLGLKTSKLCEYFGYYFNLTRRYWNVRQIAREHCGASKTIVDMVSPHIAGSLAGKKILEIGCGTYYPISLLLRSSGYDVVAIDQEYVGANVAFPVKLWRLLRQDGLEPMARHLFFDTFIGWRLRREMGNQWGCRLSSKGLRVLTMDAGQMSFPDESFDAVVSQATFEHIANVEQVVDEITRVLKKGGVFYASICLFPSLSGGHQPDYRKNPWAHLRGEQGPTTFYLNRLRKRDYMNIIGGKLEIVEVFDKERQGEELLTPEIWAELSPEYSEDDLLIPMTAIVARKAL